MAKKSHLKVRMVPESKPDSAFVYYAKKPTKGEKAKVKLKIKKYNPNTRKHEFFVEKKITSTQQIELFLKIPEFIFNIRSNHCLPDFICNFVVNIFFF